MRWTLALLLLASAAYAQGMPPASRVDSWKSPHNQKRLKLDWNVLPEFKPTKLPDGSELPPKAPTPFLLFVFQNPTKESAKLDEKVFADTRFVLACRPVKLAKIRPAQAIDIPYLAQAQGIKDPTLIFVDRDFRVRAVLNSMNEFTDSKVLGEMEKLVGDAYNGKLGPYLGRYVKLLQDAEKLWAQETKMDQLREKAAKADPGKSKEYDAEADAIEKELAPAMEAIAEEEIRLQDSLAVIGEKAEELPTTIGSGKNRRKLTPQELEALKAFQDFKRDPNPVVRAAACEDLGAIDSAVMVEAILTAANDVDIRVTEAAGKALGRMKSDESMEAMLSGISSGNAKGKLAAVLGFASIQRPYPAAAKPIAGMASGGSDDLRRAAVKALHNLKDPSTTDTLVKVLDDKEAGVAVLAAEALGDMRATAANPALLQRSTASDWALQKASIEALGKIRAKESIGPLIEMFQKEQGLVDEVIQKALVAITGQDFLFNREGWKKWWDKYGSGFVVPTDLEIADAKKKAENALKGYYNPNKKKYHTIETLSRKMVFVIDISGSMRDSIVLPPDAPQEVLDEFPDRTKIEIAKKALIDLLATIDGSVYFNIITFAGEVKPWQEGLVSGSMRTTAIKYVSKLKAMEPPRGGGGASGRGRAGGGGGPSSGEELKTDSWAALMAGFGLQDEEVPNWKARSQADTIFFVTDGVPTKGKVTDVPKLIDQITEMNRSKGVVIHVITFDKEEAKKLAPLAERNGGQCVVRGWSGEPIKPEGKGAGGNPGEKPQ